MRHALPEGLRAYKRTPLFDETSVPNGLQHEHRTKAGVWALIQVTKGRLLYHILSPEETLELDSSTPGVVRPEQPHKVALIGPVEFYVEFYAESEDAGAPHAQGGLSD